MFYIPKSAGSMCSCTVGRSSSFFIGLSLTRSSSGCWMDLLEDIFNQINLNQIQNSKTQTKWLLGSVFLPGEFHLYNKGATPVRGTVRISPQFVTIVVIYIYSCYLQLFLYLFIFIDKINLFVCCYTSKLYIYCIYSVFIPYLSKILFILIDCKSVHVF